MRQRLPWRLTPILVMILLLVAAMAPAAKVQARNTNVVPALTPSMIASPSQVAQGSTVTIQGYGFSPGGYVTISGFFNSISAGPTDGTGYFTYPLTIPNTAPNGTYSLTGTDIFSGAAAHTSFTVGVAAAGASIIASPTQTVPGASVTLSGTGFSPLATVTLTAFGLSSPTTSNSLGSFSVNIFVAAATANGSYTITASDGFHFAQTVLAVGTSSTIASIVLSPSTTPPGSQVTVTGSTFTGNQVVTISTSNIGIPTVTAVESSIGSFSAILTVPSTIVPGSYTVTASDPSARFAYATLVVGSGTGTAGVTLVLSPSAANPGQVISATGTGYTPNSIVSISGLGSVVTTTASTTGTISASLTIPSTQAVGTVTVSASDTAGRFGTATERVGLAGISLILNPTTGAAGSTTAIAGTGFQANEIITVGLATPASVLSFITGTTVTYTADANGNFSGTFPVPSQPAGSYVVLAQGNTSLIQAVAAYTLTASVATATATVTASGTPGVIAFPTPVATSTPVVGPLSTVSSAASTTYFAEGYTGTAGVNGKATFTEKLYFYNPGTVSTNVTTTYFVYDTTNNTQSSVVEHDTVAPGATVVRSVNSDAGNDRFVSAVVQGSAGVSAEMVIGRVATNGTVLDTGSSEGSSSLGQTWYLAEGYTGESLQEYITLFNPGDSAASAQVQYLPSNTPAPAAQTVNVPAKGRVTINVRSVYNGLVKKGSRNVGISVTSNQPISVDRSLYWGAGSGSGKYGYSLGSAISAGKTVQYLSFLPTANGSQSFVTVLNANGTSSTVTLSLNDASGNTIRTISATVPAGQRYTFTIPNILNGSYGVVTGVVTSTTPVVVEAGLYFGGGPNTGSHPGIVVQASAGSTVGAQANVNPAGAVLRILNTSGTLERVQVSTAGTGAATVISDANVVARAAQTIQIPAGTDPRSVVVVASGSFAATLVNGGDGSTTAWGGGLN